MFKRVNHSDRQNQLRIAVLGSGFAGLCMGIRLRQAGFDNFTIYEKADEVGGTWRANTYPGAACDVQSFLYSFSFEQNPYWSRMFAGQTEILAYMKRCARKYGLMEHIEFGRAVQGAVYDSDRAQWSLEMNDGAEVVVDVAISACGPLSIVKTPEIPGRESFDGPAFHTAEWRHDVDLTGKRVAVIGTGASAIQVVPEVASKASSVTVFQRTAPWVMPRPDRPISRFEQTAFASLPVVQKLARAAIYWSLEGRVPFFLHAPRLLRVASTVARLNMHRSVSDPALRARITPDYTMGCKRILTSNDYYPALNQEHVDVTTRAAEITKNGVVDGDGNEHEVDVIVYATGFHASENMIPFEVRGADGRTLAECWSDGAEAYKGTVVSNFPNLFFIVGPNTGLGHSSMIFMIEAMVNFTMLALKELCSTGAQAVEVREDVQRNYNERLQQRLRGTVWQDGGCVSWYQAENGKNTTLWPGYTWEFRLRTAHLDPSNFVFHEVRDKLPSASLLRRVVAMATA